MQCGRKEWDMETRPRGPANSRSISAGNYMCFRREGKYDFWYRAPNPVLESWKTGRSILLLREAPGVWPFWAGGWANGSWHLSRSASLCIQVIDIDGTNFNQSQYQHDKDPEYPSCDECVQTCPHVLPYNKEGRVDARQQTIAPLDEWLKDVGMDTGSRQCLVRYLRGRGRITMEEIVWGTHSWLLIFARSQDIMGWQRFMEGMILKECQSIQQTFLTICGSKLSISCWGKELMTQLLDVTHSQWLYRNIHVHESVSSAIASQWKEEVQHGIEKQQELGKESLTTEDPYSMEVNLDDMETISAERQECWLLAFRAAREAFILWEISDGTVTDGTT